MSVEKVFLKYKTDDFRLNEVLETYKDKINVMIDEIPWTTSSVDFIRLKDTNESHHLEVLWDEDDIANRTLRLYVNAADAALSLTGTNRVIAWEATTSINLRGNAELRLYDNGNYVGIEAPALGADKIWTWMATDGTPNQVIKTDGSGVLSFMSAAGDVTATNPFGTDNRIIRSDGTAKVIQHTGITIDNSDNISGVGTMACGVITWTDGTSTRANTAYTHSQVAGGNSVHVSVAENTAWDAANAHISATGASHSYIDQSVVAGGTPTFGKGQIDAGANTAWQLLKLENNNGVRMTVSGAGAVAMAGTLASGNITVTGDISLNGGNITNTAGDLTINSTASGADLDLEANTYIKSATARDTTTASGATALIGATIGVFWRSTSAKKYKDKITDLELDSSLIYNLRPVSFNSKCKHDDENKRFIGLIADEIEQYYPGIINYNKNNEAESYDNQMLMTLMLNEIQNLNKRIRSLEQG